MSITTALTDFALENHLQGVIDAANTISPLVAKMMARIQPSGGGKIKKPIRYVDYGRTQAWGEFSEFRPLKRDVIGTTSVDHVGLAEPVDLSQDRLDEIKGSKIEFINYMDSYLEAAKDSFMEYFSTSIYSDGSVGGTNQFGQPTTNLLGLQAIMAKDTSYAGIATTDAPLWNAQTIDISLGATPQSFVSGMTFAATGSVTSATMLDSTKLEYWPYLLGFCTELSKWGNEQVDMIITNPYTYAQIKKTLQPIQKIESDFGTAGFTGITWEGIKIWSDKKCPAGWLFGLNTKYLEFHAVPNRMITFKPFEKIPASDVINGAWMFKGNMLCTSRRHQFAIKNLPTS